MTQRFSLIKRFPNGHSYFRDAFTGHVAIADQSGSTPDQTDDGVLFLDFTEQPTATRVTVPLREPSGAKSRTFASDEEAEWILKFMLKT